MKKVKKGIFLLTIIFVFCLISYINVAGNEEKETLNSTINFDQMELNEDIVPHLFNWKEDVERWYLGKWVKPDKWTGGIDFEITDAGESMVKVKFVDYTYGRIADFETKPFRIFEEIKDKMYYGRFKWDTANGGWGYLYVNKHEAKVILEETRAGGGTINQIHTTGAYIFNRPYRPSLTYALDKIQKNVDIHPKGYMPIENVTYVYLSVDGDSTMRESWNYNNKKYHHIIYWSKERDYEIDRDGLSVSYEYRTKNDDGEIEEKVSNDRFFKFSMKKGDSWETDDAYYEVIDDDFPLINGLENVLVLKRTFNDKKDEYAKYKYYHKNFGLLGWGRKSNNQYGHKPVYLLDKIDIH